MLTCSIELPDPDRHHADGVGGAEGAQGAHHRDHGGRAGPRHALVYQLVQLAECPLQRRGQRQRQLGAGHRVLRPTS